MLQSQILCDTFLVGILGNGDPLLVDSHTGVVCTGWKFHDVRKPYLVFLLFPWHKYLLDYWGGICYDMGVAIPH